MFAMQYTRAKTLTMLGLAIVFLIAGCGGSGGGSAEQTAVMEPGGEALPPTAPIAPAAPDAPATPSPTLPVEKTPTETISTVAVINNDVLLITVPLHTATDVSLDTAIVLAYKRKIAAAEVVDVVLSSQAGTLPSSFYISSSSVVVTPMEPLAPATHYTVRVTTLSGSDTGSGETTVAQLDFMTNPV